MSVTSLRSGLHADGSSEREPPQTEPRRGDLTVLVVEDDALVRRMTRDLLCRCGCNVIAVGDGAEARDVLSYADAVIIDVGLPDCSGATLVEQLRWNDGELPVIIASARIDEELRERFVSDDRTQFLPKPYTEGQLRRAVDRMKAMERPSA